MKWDLNSNKMQKFTRHELEEFRRDLMLYAQARVGDKALAEDLVQEAFVRYFSRSGSEPVSSPKGYLIRTVYNLSIDHFRSKQIRLAAVASETDKPPDGETSPEQLISESQLQAKFDQAYTALPERQQQIFYMRRMEGHSTAQIASRFNLSRRMVQKYMAQIVLHFQRYLMDDSR